MPELPLPSLERPVVDGADLPRAQPNDDNVTAALQRLHPLLPLLGKCIAHLNDIVLITDAEHELPGPRILFVNEAFQRLTGYTQDEVIGRTPRLLQGPKTDRAELNRIAAALHRWEPVRAELINYRKDGSEFCVELDIVPIADDDGRWTHWVAIQRDVTARKADERQQQLREAQRVQSLGTLASGIAHDFNNIIAAILGNVVLARQESAEGQSVLAALEQINNAGLRARRLVQQILAYSRHEPHALVSQRLAAIVTESTDLLRSTLPAGVTLNVKLCDEPLHVAADATQLQQVLLNLGTNAWHAMQGLPGRIDVEMSAVTRAREPERTGSLFGPSCGAVPQPRRCALIKVSDDGSGMDAGTLARIFEPYYTTKAIGQGTGLGLSVVSGIIAAHGASVTVESEPGHGTVFDLIFPLLDGEAFRPAASSVVAPVAASAQQQRVILVDDDDVVLLVLQALLTRAGFQVRAFIDAGDAITAIEADPSGVDIVVTDLNMPKLSGLALARAVTAIRPGLPVVVGSGYVGDELADTLLQVGVAATFRKEYAAEQLGGLLLESLARAGAAAALQAASTP